MNENKPKLLVVEDSPEDIRILMQLLSENYAVVAATSADDALQILAENNNPDLILMDINMPGTSGYEACKILKQSPELNDIDVLFLSGNDSTQEVLEGFEVGAVDYIVKPYVPEILLSKIKNCLSNRAGRINLKQAAQYASTVAMSAMTDMGDMGTIINFLRASFAIRSLDDLAGEVCKALKSFELSSCIYLYFQDEKVYSCSEQSITELEKNLMYRITGSQDPIIALSQRLLLVKPGVVILIKNLPQDPDKASRIKDHLMILLEGVLAKLGDLQNQSRVQNLLNNNINLVVRQAETALLDIQNLQEAHKKSSVDIMESMVRDVESSFYALGLTDAQEEKLLNIMSSAVTSALNHFEAGEEIDEKIRGIIDSLALVSSGVSKSL